MPNILFRCDGYHEIGLGHVVRCMALADELKEGYKCKIFFAMRDSDLGEKIIEKKYPVATPTKTDSEIDEVPWLQRIINENKIDAVVVDVRGRLTRRGLENIGTCGVLTVDIDDPEDKRLAADMAFYPPVPQVEEMDWAGFKGKLHTGWEWIILRKDFHQANPTVCTGNEIPTILVTMGGSDPKLMTFKVVEALDRLENIEFKSHIVVGAGFTEKERIVQMIEECNRPTKLFENVRDMASLMKTADLAICSFGVSAYELAAVGVPAIHLCLSRDHERSSKSFVREGIAVCMGQYGDVDCKRLARSVEELILSPEKRRTMERSAFRLIDGNGVYHIASRILYALN